MPDKKIDNEAIEELYDVILPLKTSQDCKILFNDLCTYKEIEQMAQRVKAARLLLKGKTYTQVISETDISSATLSRVSRCVQYGEGYKNFLRDKDKNGG